MITQQEIHNGHTLHIQVTEWREKPAQTTETRRVA
jgi:hypothetical protein